MIMSFGEDEMVRAIKVQFLVVDCSSIYQYIFGQPTLAELIVVASTVHLKMKYYTAKGQVATLHGDIKAAQRCFKAPLEGLNSIKVTPLQDAMLLLPVSSKAWKSLPHVGTIDLDNCFCSEAEDQTKTKSSLASSTEDPLLPFPDGDFELFTFGEDLKRGVKIEIDMPDLAKK